MSENIMSYNRHSVPGIYAIEAGDNWTVATGLYEAEEAYRVLDKHHNGVVHLYRATHYEAIAAEDIPNQYAQSWQLVHGVPQPLDEMPACRVGAHEGIYEENGVQRLTIERLQNRVATQEALIDGYRQASERTAGLKEAKDFVEDDIQQAIEFLQRVQAQVPQNKIAAIKLLRNNTNAGGIASLMAMARDQRQMYEDQHARMLTEAAACVCNGIQSVVDDDKCACGATSAPVPEDDTTNADELHASDVADLTQEDTPF